MRLLNWGKRQKPSAVPVVTEKVVRGREATIAACTNDPVFIYNKYIRIRSLEHPVDELNDRQMRSVKEFKARQESEDAQLIGEHVSA
jgi:hypothetical protein